MSEADARLLSLRLRRLRELALPEITPERREKSRRFWLQHGPAELCHPDAGYYMCPEGTGSRLTVTGPFVECLSCGYCGARLTMTYHGPTPPSKRPLWGLPPHGDNCYLLPDERSRRFPVRCARDGRIGVREVQLSSECTAWTPGHYPDADTVYFDGEPYYVYVIFCPRGLPVNVVAYRGPRSVPDVPTDCLLALGARPPFKLSFCLNNGELGDTLQRDVYCPCCSSFTPLLVRISRPADDPEAYRQHLLRRGYCGRASDVDES